MQLVAFGLKDFRAIEPSRQPRPHDLVWHLLDLLGVARAAVGHLTMVLLRRLVAGEATRRLTSGRVGQRA
jgi:hypothetical protein